ncbi:carbohydrate binding domain-containing protein [Mesobacillus foraminis]|uniref:carbohydrate binding domain-containing protein n=1 Tax=Mesobacillus foraminis TaxID=279826 RepID=UPI000EF47CDE|nr:carbohydrate binding domain-containing protein [Mesobacillus foraminis]
MKQSRLFIVLVFLLALSPMVSPSTLAVTGESATNAATQDDLVDLGTPIQTAQTIDAVYGQENGVNVVYTTVTGSASSGDWAQFNVIDIDNQKLLGSYPLEGTSNSWAHVITPDGKVFIGASKKMFMYSPETREVKDLGVPINGTESIWSLTSDEKGNVYGGIYSASVGGRIFKIDANTLAATDFLGKRVDEKENYVRSMVFYDGSIYAGTGTTNGRVFKINAESKEIERIELPGTENEPIYEGRYNSMGAVYGLTLVDHYLFAFFNGPFTLHVYDLEKQEWKEKGFSNIRGLMAVTGEHEGKVYTSKKDGHMWEIDVNTLEERSVMPFDGSIRNSKWMYVKDQPDFEGEAMVTISYDGKVVLYDPPNQKKVVMPSVVKGLPINLQAIERGPDGKIYVSSYMGTEAAIYDPEKNDEFSLFPLGQAEGFGSVGDTMYYGVYPKAEIFGWDTRKPMPEKGPPLLFDIGEKQDRPFVLREGEGKLLIGSISGYSEHGGALTIYDPEASTTEKPVFDVYRNVVENQSIAGLAYKDGIIYGSTTIYGGLGSNPIAAAAKLFTFDMKTRTKLQEWDLELEGLNTPSMISGLTVGPDGLIWGTANGFVFAFDPKTHQVVKSKNVYPHVTKYGTWRPMKLYWGLDGLLYTNVAETLTVINPATMESKKLADKAPIFTLNNHNDIYFTQATRVVKKRAEKPSDIQITAPNKMLVKDPQRLKVTASLYDWKVDVTNNVEYVISNPELVEIKDGVIHPLKPGEVTITAKIIGNYSSPIVVQIEEPKPVRSNLKVPNADFEQGNEDLLNWQVVKGEETNLISTNEVKSGERSLQLFSENSKGKTVIESESIEVQPGREYTASVYTLIQSKNTNRSHLKNESGNVDSMLDMKFYDENGIEIELEENHGKLNIPRNEWFKIELMNKAPEKAKYTKITLKGSLGWAKNVYFDSVNLTTWAFPYELPKAENLSVDKEDIAEGDNVTISLKATQGSDIIVKEGETVLAEGKGENERNVKLTIPSPTVGTHDYKVLVSVPGLGSETTLHVPPVRVHPFSGLELSERMFELLPNEQKELSVFAKYGPVTKNVSDESILSTEQQEIVRINKNLVTGLKEGEASILASYKGKTVESSVRVSNFQLQKMEIDTVNHVVLKGSSIQATVMGFYENKTTGKREYRDISNLATLTATPQQNVSIEGMKITGLMTGETAVTATYNGKTAEKTITVINPGDPYKRYLELENGNFEKINPDGTISGWSIRLEKPGYTSIESSSDQAYSGEKSIKLIDATTTGYTALQSNLMEVEPGKTYTAGVKVYLGDPPVNPDTGTSFSSSRTLFQVRYYDEKNQEINQTAGLGTTIESPRGRWLPAEVTSTAPQGAKYIRLVLSGSYSWVSNVYYDDAYIYNWE